MTYKSGHNDDDQGFLAHTIIFAGINKPQPVKKIPDFFIWILFDFAGS